jgi:fatty acid synthase, animal type
VINTSDVTAKQGCKNLIQTASKLGPIGGIFNLAAVLHDQMFENQTEKSFAECLASKAIATKKLDEVSRQLCPLLKHFVVFSTVSCGRGNAGQSNYGMANSVMERIIEERSKLGFPAKAIQWGPIGDVGMLADLQEKKMDLEIGGILLQGIASCLEVLDKLLTVNEPIVSSMIVANKKSISGDKRNLVDAILNILSIREKNSISMDIALSSLGLDSLMSVEIQQVLERDFNIVMTAQEIRNITLRQLEKRVNSKESHDEIAIKEFQHNLEYLLTSLGDEKTSDQNILKLESLETETNVKVLIIPGLEGMASKAWHDLAKNLKFPTFILQLGNTAEATDLENIFDVVSKVSLGVNS